VIAWREGLLLTGLALVPLMALFAVWAERRRRRDLARVVEAGLQGVVVPDVDPRRRHLRDALLIAAVGALVVALAGPEWGFRWEQVKREGVDVVVALDASRSMLAVDVKPNRLTRAKLALHDLLGELGGDRIALVAFAGTAFVECPLTVDFGVFAQSLDSVDTTLIPRGGTAIAAAIDESLGAFEGRQGKYQAIVLITDGEDHAGDVKAAAKRAAARGVKIFTVGIGTPGGDLIPLAGGGFLKDRAGQVVKSRLDEKTLGDIAVATGGVYVRASGPSLGLPELYRDYIATMQPRELTSTLERRWKDRYQWPLAVALVLLALEPWVGNRRRRATMALALGLVAAWPTTAAAWPGTASPARRAASAYDAGDFEAAADGYNRALTDAPDSVDLHYNLGAAEYRRKEWDKAAAAWTAAGGEAKDEHTIARAAYNLGNVQFQKGEAEAGSEPQKAIEAWTTALVAYRRALGADPTFEDVKYNYEYVQRRIKELRDQLEKQKKDQKNQQQKQDQQQSQQQQKQDQQKQDQQKQDQQQQAQQNQEKQQDQQQQQAEQGQQQKQESQQQAAQQQARSEHKKEGQEAGAAGAAGEPGKRDERMTPQEAAALLDSERSEELHPRDMVRGQVAGEVPPAEDW
jgi:Ca-activated chloride channel family protein